MCVCVCVCVACCFFSLCDQEGLFKEMMFKMLKDEEDPGKDL